MNKKNTILALALSASFVVGGASVAEASEERLITSESPILNEDVVSDINKEEKPQDSAQPTNEAENEEKAPAENPGLFDKTVDFAAMAKAEENLKAGEDSAQNEGEGLEISPTEAPEAQAAPAEAAADSQKPKYETSKVVEDEKKITENGTKDYRQSENAGQGMKVKVTKEELNEEKEGIRVEVQNPSGGSNDKRSFGVEINLDKQKSERTYNGYAVSDSVRNSPIKPTEGGFLDKGQKLPTATEDNVTYKPSDDTATVTKKRQSQVNINSTEKDREHINNKDTGKTTLAWQGKYGTDNPNAKMFDGENFEVIVGVNPYPNENNQLNLIQIEGEKTVEKVPVKNQYVVSKARISNLDSSYKIDTGEYDELGNLIFKDVNIDESNRITGVVLHPSEDIVVEGAEAILITASNLEDMKKKTKDDSLTAGQIVFKMPTGALEDENSIFNDDKFKGLQNLRAKFFARPRTKDEFTNLANGLKFYDGDETFGYVSTGAGERTITHNGEEVTIDKQGIARYDHYNLVGEMTINLDDTKYYDQSFKDGNGDDTAKHTSSKVKPGESFEVNMYTPEGDAAADNQKTADEMNKAKSDGEAKGLVNLDFVNVENEKIANKLGTTVDKLSDDQKWKVDVNEGDISGFTVTPPKSARPGEFIAVPIEYTYTNGSKDVHWFHFVVQGSDNNRPEYKAEVGYQGDTLTQTPEIPQTEEAQKKN